MKNFSEGLKYAMAQANMSQSALSEKSGCSKAAISQYLSGKNTPGPAKVKGLADALGVSVEYLMGFEVPPVKEPAPSITRIGTRQAALDNNMMVDDLKAQLVKGDPGHEVTFKVV